MNGVYLIRVSQDPQHLGQVLYVDPDSGKALRSSRINSLHLRSLTELGDAFVAVSGLEGKPGGVKLVKLDKTSLESVAESKSDVYAESAVLSSGASLYVVARSADGSYHLASFAAADLAEQARSKEAVEPYSLMREASGSIIVQLPGSGFALFKADTLEKSKEIKP